MSYHPDTADCGIRIAPLAVPLTQCAILQNNFIVSNDQRERRFHGV